MTVSDEIGAGRATADADQSMADGDRSRTDESRSSVTVYRWSCPICGESRPGIASGDEDPSGKAEFSLRQHVLTSDDDRHGPANVYPREFDPDAAGQATTVE